MAYYIDTSALAKLVVQEPETEALQAWILEIKPVLVVADLARTELVRATRRRAADRIAKAREVLESVILVKVSSATFDAAARLEPTELRSLDALHLAVALELGDDLEALISYDDRLSAAAQSYGVTVIAPTA